MRCAAGRCGPGVRSLPPASAACRRAVGSSAVHGRLQVRHTQLLLRGGARTPFEPVEPESYWRAALPEKVLAERLSRTHVGSARIRHSDPYPDGCIWGELTTRGADEAYAVGRRLAQWMADDDVARAQEAEGAGGPGVPVRVLATPDRRALFTTRAVLNGLCPGQRVRIDTSAEERLRVGAAVGSADMGALDVANDTALWQDITLELMEILGLDGTSLRAENWTRLLDVAECTTVAGLLAQGELTDASRRALFSAPLRCAISLMSSSASWARAVGPLVQMTLDPCTRAGDPESSERLRVVVLPGFSLLCLARAIGLNRAFVWPAPTAGLMLETLVDEADATFIRFWQFRDSWELRPAWHDREGPVPLQRLLEAVEPLVGDVQTLGTAG